MIKNHAKRLLAAVLAMVTLASMFTFAANAATNLAVIYYRGYTSPYIHYQTSSGSWTTAPGYAMEKNNEVEGYTHKYTINLGSKTSTKLCFNNGSGTWDNNNSQDYTAKTGNNYYVTKGTFVSTLKADVKVNKTTADVNEALSFTASASGGYTDYQYKFTFTNLDTNKVTETKYSSSVGCSQSFTEAGNYKATVSVKDYAGTVATDYVNFTVESKEFKVTSFEVTPVKNVGLYEFANMKVNAVGGSGQYFYKYTYSIYGQEHVIYDYSQASQASYQFANVGTYTINAYVKDGIGGTPVKVSQKFVVNQTYVFELNADKTTVKAGETVKITPTMYNEASVIKPEHYFYSVTDENGVKTDLTTSSDKTLSWTPTKAGTYKVRLDVKYVGKTIAFNTIDITVEEDVLRIESFDVTPGKNVSGYITVGKYEYVNMKVVAAGGAGDYQYKYEYAYDRSGDVICDYSRASQYTHQFSKVGTYVLTVTVKDQAGFTTSASQLFAVNDTNISKLTANKTTVKQGETVKITPTVTDEASVIKPEHYFYSVTDKNGVTKNLTASSDKTLNWTPTEAGAYTVRLDIKYAGQPVASKTINLTVEEKPANTVTIYYKGYSTPYIHYQVQGKSWTSVPGKAMTATSEVAGYTHKYTIDLGTATYANVCFNDGKNNWDSKNGANYRFTAGEWTYSNGTIKPYEPTLKIKSFDITPANGVINEGESVRMAVTMTDPNASFMAQFSYVDPNGKEFVIYDYAYAYACSKQFTQAGTYKLIVRVKETPYSSEILTAEKTVTVKATPKFAIKSFEINPADGIVTVMDSVKMTLTMEDSSKGYLAQFVCIDEKGNETVVYDYAYAISGSKQFTQPGKYTLMVRVKETPYSSEILTASKTVTVLPKEQNLDVSMTSNKSLNCGNYENHTFTAKAAGGTAPYQYKFYYKNGGQTYGTQDFSTKNTYSFQPTVSGTYYVYVTVKDATGKTITENTTVTSNATIISAISADQTKGTVGKAVKFKATRLNEPSVFTSANYAYTVTKNGVTTKLTTNSDKTANWTPTEAGTYQVKLVISYNGKEVANKTVDYEVEKKVANTLTIYYKGYSTPYIHYQIAGKSWTTAPGVKMTATNEVAGYTHKAVIDLGTATYATVCFNNGNGSWDSNNGKNYKFDAGVYTFSGGKIEEYDNNAMKISSFTISPSNGIINVNESFKLDVTVSNATSYMTQFAYRDSNGNEYIIYDYAYANGCLKQFTKAGTYTLIVRVKETPYSTDILTAEKTVTVKDPTANTVTIYYKGYSTPYIHYQVGNGSWTSVPGVKMTETSEKAGYTHKVVIDLGSATYANVCFNDGKGNWDSKNGANYKFYAGTYTFANGKYTKI